MITCIATLKSTSPYSQSRALQSEKKTGESPDSLEQRAWHERIHADIDGNVFIPPMAFKNCLSEVAKFLSQTVPGKGKATYTKHFEAGISVMEPVMLGIKKSQVTFERLFLPSDGVRGSGKRVWKNYPIIPAWRGQVEIFALDPVLTEKPEKIREYLEHAGKFIGIGRFRPRNNGYYGRFIVEDFKIVK